MSVETSIFEKIYNDENENAKITLITKIDHRDNAEMKKKEKRLQIKVDLKLCIIANLLCSLNLFDNDIILSTLIINMLSDLDLNQRNRYFVFILIFTMISMCFQLLVIIIVRLLDFRVFFSLIIIFFDLITLIDLLYIYFIFLASFTVLSCLLYPIR